MGPGERGRQYGALMASEMKHIYDRAIVEKLVNENGLSIENMKGRAAKFYANYPFRFKEILRGMSETSEMNLEQVSWSTRVELLAATALDIPQCTGIAAWGDYVSETLIYGRNYDYLPGSRSSAMTSSLPVTIRQTDRSPLPQWDTQVRYMQLTE